MGWSAQREIELISSFEDMRSWNLNGVQGDYIYKVCTEKMRKRYGHEIGILISNDLKHAPVRNNDFIKITSENYNEILLIFQYFPYGVDNIIVNYLTSFEEFLQSLRMTPINLIDIFPCKQFNIRRYGKKISKWEMVKNTIKFHTCLNVKKNILICIK